MIEAAEEADLPAVRKIQELCFKEPWTRIMLESTFAHPHSIIRVLRGKDGIRGFSIALRAADELELLSVAVHPEHIRRGLGRRLCQDLERRAEKKGVRVVYLEVRASNKEARAFYSVMGYEIVAKRERYYQDGEDAMIMRLNLPEC